MKNYLAICFCFSFFTHFSQTVENDIEYFNSGQMKWKGQKSCIVTKDDKDCKPFGLWTYWYKDGQMKSEIFIPGGKGNLPTRYINMWQQDGFQILIKGIGFYYEKENRGSGEYDSLAYQVKDSLANGMFTHYRKHGISNYYLIETGQFSDGKRYGTFKFRDTVKLYEEETNYDNGEISSYKYLHPNLKVKEEGKTINGKKEGLAKFYNDKGVLIKEVSYKKDTECGEYKEYYDSGILKISGHYKHTNGFMTHSTFDVSGKENIRKSAADNIPKKSGEWKYYDEKGNLTKTENLK